MKLLWKICLHSSLLGVLIFNLSCSKGSDRKTESMRVFVFTKTGGYVHESIPDGVQAIKKLGQENNFEVTVSDDSLRFTKSELKKYNVVVFLNNSGKILGDSGRENLKQFIRRGGGFVGVHGASTCETDWPWYGQLVGARFKDHPVLQQGTVKVIDKSHLSTKHLPDEWVREDEWYNFYPDISQNIHVLAIMDESSYEGGTNGPDHPFSWYQEFEGGRSWYTAGGHKKEHYQDSLFVKHILGGILYAAGK